MATECPKGPSSGGKLVSEVWQWLRADMEAVATGVYARRGVSLRGCRFFFAYNGKDSEQ